MDGKSKNIGKEKKGAGKVEWLEHVRKREIKHWKKDKGKEKEWRSLGNKEKEIKKKKGERGGGID